MEIDIGRADGMGYRTTYFRLGVQLRKKIMFGTLLKDGRKMFSGDNLSSSEYFRDLERQDRWESRILCTNVNIIKVLDDAVRYDMLH